MIEEKYKELLEKWHEIREKLEPIEKECMAKEIRPGEKIPTMPEICTSDEYWDLVEKQRKIEDEMRGLRKEYQQPPKGRGSE